MPILQEQKSAMYRKYGMPILQEQKSAMYRKYGMPISHRYMGKGCSLQPYSISTLHGGHVTY